MPPSVTADRWTSLCRLDAVPDGGLHPVAAAGHKLVVARPAGEPPAVLDNRCPHEGYPLSQGRLDGGLLTCCWHNWKFEAASGRCVMGGEDVARWPCRVVGGEVQADLSGPAPEQAVPPLLASLAAGVLEHDTPRAVRDALRLLGFGVTPRRPLLELAALDARHGEWGSSHALALAADAARVLDARGDAPPQAAAPAPTAAHADGGAGDTGPTAGVATGPATARAPLDLSGPRALLAVAPVIDQCGESDARLPRRERAPAGEWLGEDALRDAVEREDRAAAQAQLGGALADGLDWQALVRLMLSLNTDHFTDFGHPLIYTVKAAELVRDGDDQERLADLAFGLLDDLLFATREDTLPYWGRYQRRLDGWGSRLDAWWSAQAAHASGAPATSASYGRALRDAVLDGTADEALDRLEQAFDAAVPAEEIARWLVAAAAHRLLRFDVRLDADPSVAENWIWVTHRFTFAAAVRHAVRRLDAPRALRLLHQTLAFTHSGRPMDAPPERRTPVDPLPMDLDAVLAAVAAERADRAVPGAAALLRDEHTAGALGHALEDLCLSDPAVRPIVVTHVVKTTWAALEERGALAGHEDRDVPVLAVVRFLASPVVERRVAALVGTSIDWVVHGKVPRKLTQ